jgi:hypothetical protein
MQGWRLEQGNRESLRKRNVSKIQNLRHYIYIVRETLHLHYTYPTVDPITVCFQICFQVKLLLFDANRCENATIQKF